MNIEREGAKGGQDHSQRQSAARGKLRCDLPHLGVPRAKAPSRRSTPRRLERRSPSVGLIGRENRL